ncbi:MAG: Ig-like domain-containing protein [Treponema sp.]|jgi:uncharacterized protein YjdB|nr:Ig-like domain-containing protein [Treponema sp.]
MIGNTKQEEKAKNPMVHKRFLKRVFTFLVLALITTMTLLVCSNPVGQDLAAGSLSEKYTGVKGSTICELTVTQSADNAQLKAVARAAFNPAEGDSYVLKIIENGVTQISSGIVKAFSNSKFTLAPSINIAVSFEVKINSNGITNITGTITIQSGDTIAGLGEITPTGTSGGNPGGFASGNPDNNPDNSSGGGEPNAYVPIRSAWLFPSSLQMEVGESETLELIVYPSNATNKNVSWTISSGAVSLEDVSMFVSYEDVSDGSVLAKSVATILAKSVGWAIIHADIEGYGSFLYPLESTVEVGSVGSFSVTGVIIGTRYEHNASSLSLAVGEQYGLMYASIEPRNARNINVRWTSSNPDVVTVTRGTGLTPQITAVSVGTAIITVTTEDGNKTASITVTVY